MSNVDFSKLLDCRNLSLYETVKEKYTIIFEYSGSDEYSVYIQDQEATFYVPIKNYCIDSFTHELLHLYICYCDVYLGGNFKIIMSKSNILRRILDVELSEHITNCIEHKLMLPMYLKLGFDREKFLLDYNLFKMESGFMKLIQIHYKVGKKLSINAVKNFIGKYFALNCDPNPNFNYAFELQQLQKIDSTLFGVLQAYYNKWEAYDFVNDNHRFYDSINSSLYNGLKQWLHKKEFID